MSIFEINQAVVDLALYPEEYLVEESEMGQNRSQETLLDYLKSVLRYLYSFEKWLVAGDFHLYHKAVKNSQNLIVPDISVFKDIAISDYDQRTLESWDMRRNQQPAPPVVFEISSSSTGAGDIAPDKKPATYGRIGVKEYFAYDPSEKPVWKDGNSRRLRGWRYEQGKPIELEPDGRGWLWSAQLESWLVEAGHLLVLYDIRGQLRPTEKEADAAERLRLEQRLTEFESRLKQLEDQAKNQAQ